MSQSSFTEARLADYCWLYLLITKDMINEETMNSNRWIVDISRDIYEDCSKVYRL